MGQLAPAEALVSHSFFHRLALAAIALGAFTAFDARAVSFGPYAVIAPSSITNQDGSIDLVPSGVVSFDIATVPHLTPQLFELTGVAITAGPLSFGLDPSIASPALGVIQPDGRFLIPTLFLVGNDGVNDFDLAIPNLSGATFGAPDGAFGFFTQFQVDNGTDIFDAVLYVNVPEPGPALLLVLGCSALAVRRREEIAR